MITTRNVLLIAHVFTAILTVGPVTVAGSAFPAQVKWVTTGHTATARTLHRICRQYGTLSIAVGVLGAVLADESALWGELWVQISIATFLTGLVVLLAGVVPLQRQVLATLDEGSRVGQARIGRLHALTGVYSLTWAATLILMVIQPR